MTQIKAGRKLDALIATKVMGWEIEDIGWCKVWKSKESGRSYHLAQWRPSINITRAWQVFEKIQPTLPFLTIGYDDDENYWHCSWWMDGAGLTSATADTAPLAICRLALLSVKESV